MIERVNVNSGAMVGKGRDIAIRSAAPQQIASMRRTSRSKAGAKRALKVIEAVVGKPRRWR